ncbi:hypothetical protein Mapa_013411 [Marchantia paleacea]|nr:hypothetical protein Mapa_013411 [Marchantia paleacea]
MHFMHWTGTSYCSLSFPGLSYRQLEFLSYPLLSLACICTVFCSLSSCLHPFVTVQLPPLSAIGSLFPFDITRMTYHLCPRCFLVLSHAKPLRLIMQDVIYECPSFELVYFFS